MVIFLTGCAHAPLQRSEEDWLAGAERFSDRNLPVLILRGDPYQIGFQHGRLMRHEIHAEWRQIMSFALGQIPVPVLNRLLIHWKLDRAYKKMRPYISPDRMEEMHGLADGAGIPLKTVHRAHAIPDLYPTLCANGAYYGPATADGRLFHLRNLDWSREMGVHEYACVFAVHPDGKNAFVHFGYTGFIGVLTGINEHAISVGQIGCDTVDYTLEGEPMPFLLRRVLEESGDLETASAVVEKASRTYGYNYIFANAKAQRAVALETTAHHFSLFHENDSRERESGYGLTMDNVIIRSDTAFDPAVRSFQTASGGNPDSPELETPSGKAYEIRYRRQAELVQKAYGSIDEQVVVSTAEEIAPGSNIQSVVFAYPEVWVANAEGDLRAVDTEYHHFNIEELLKK